MKDSMIAFTLRAALFLLIANVVMLFIVKFDSAEWYVTLFSVVLMTVLVLVIQIVSRIRRRGKKP